MQLRILLTRVKLAGNRSLRLGVERRLLRPLVGLLCAGGSGTKHAQEAINGCELGACRRLRPGQSVVVEPL